jgi:hypothetical protein
VRKALPSSQNWGQGFWEEAGAAAKESSVGEWQRVRRSPPEELLEEETGGEALEPVLMVEEAAALLCAAATTAHTRSRKLKEQGGTAGVRAWPRRAASSSLAAQRSTGVWSLRSRQGGCRASARAAASAREVGACR